LTTAPAGNTLTIDGNASETINGDTTVLLYILGDYLIIQSDGTNWKIIGDGRQKHKTLLTNNAAQSLSNSTVTDITYNTETLDNAGSHSTSANTELVNIRRTGMYVLGLMVVFANNVTGVRQIGFVCSAENDPAVIFGNPGSGEVQCFFTVPMYLTSGSTVKSFAWQASGTSLNINNSGSTQQLIFSVVEQ
jgi:hypothetical protein